MQALARDPGALRRSMRLPALAGRGRASRALAIWLIALLSLCLGAWALCHVAAITAAPAGPVAAWSGERSNERRSELTELEEDEEREDSMAAPCHLAILPEEPAISGVPRAARRHHGSTAPPRVDLEPGRKPPALAAALG